MSKLRKFPLVNKSKELNAKIGSADEVFWTELQAKIDADILNAKRQIEVNERILLFTAEKIEKEKKDLNS